MISYFLNLSFTDVYIYFFSCLISHYFFLNAIKKLDARNPKHKEVLYARNVLKMACYIPYFNTFYALVCLFLFAYGFLFKKK